MRRIYGYLTLIIITVSCSCTNHNVEKRPLDLEAFDLSFTKEPNFMWPVYSGEKAVIERSHYTLNYSEKHEQALWVAYKLSADSLAQQRFKRKNDFRKDPRVKTSSAALSDYKGSGYDRGHLAPAADFSYNQLALSQTFYMSNISPQRPAFNRGIWKDLEMQVRKWVQGDKELYVVTGPVLDKQFSTIGANNVSVPEYYYKVVLDIHKPGIKAIAFLMKNEKGTAPLKTFAVSIDEVERRTGLDFFPLIPDAMENVLEKNKSVNYWFP